MQILFSTLATQKVQRVTWRWVAVSSAAEKQVQWQTDAPELWPHSQKKRRNRVIANQAVISTFSSWLVFVKMLNVHVSWRVLTCILNYWDRFSFFLIGWQPGSILFFRLHHNRLCAQVHICTDITFLFVFVCVYMCVVEGQPGELTQVKEFALFHL